jgi:hypothetical protein
LPHRVWRTARDGSAQPSCLGSISPPGPGQVPAAHGPSVAPREEVRATYLRTVRALVELSQAGGRADETVCYLANYPSMNETGL